MSRRFLIFALALILPQAVFASVIRVSVFLGVNSGCDSAVLDPAIPVDAGSFPVGSLAGPSFCLFNTGSTPVSLTNVVVTGTDFSGGHDALPFILQPNSANFYATGANFQPTAAGTRTGQISFVSDAPDSPQTFSLTGIGFTDFGISIMNPVSTSATVTAGQTANYHLLVLRATSPPAPASFTGIITISCSGMPTGANCSVNPPSFSVTDTSGPDLFVAVTTTARPSAGLRPHRSPFWWAFAAVLGIGIAASRRRQRFPVLLATLMLAGFAVSCGGHSQNPGSGPPGPTPAGTYTFPVTATSNGVSHTRTLTLVVK